MSNEWNGEGLPPVGTHCEVTWGNKTGWAECVTLPGNSVALRFTFSDSWIVKDDMGNPEFRPLKSDREREIEAMIEVMSGRCGSLFHQARALRDAGYSKTGADAPLISASKDMYEALKGLLDEINDCAEPLDWENYQPGREALAKARGEQ